MLYCALMAQNKRKTKSPEPIKNAANTPNSIMVRSPIAADNRPVPAQIDAFLHFVRSGNDITNFPGLDWSSPQDREAKLELLATFETIAFGDERGLVPCPICSPHAPKYSKGCLVWFPEEKSTRAIGHCCAKRSFTNFVAAESKFNADNKLDRCVAFLESNLSDVGNLKKQLFQLIIRAGECQAIRAEFSNMAPDLVRVLRKIPKSGELLVDRELKSIDPNATTRNIRQRIGTLRGREVYSPHFNILATLRKTLNDLGDIPDLGDEIEIFDRICDESSNPKTLFWWENSIKSAREGIKRSISSIESFHDFFTTKNINTLNTWFELSHFGFRAEMRQNRMFIATEYGEYLFYKKIPVLPKDFQNPAS